MKRNFLILLILITLFTLKTEANPNNTSIIFEKIDPTKAYLIGRINNWDNVSEYGFAYSNFPLPPILDQEVNYIEIKGKPYKRDTFSLYLDELEQGKHYFFSTYYVINGNYHYSSSYSYTTPKKLKLGVENKIIEYTTDEITLPINIIQTRDFGFGKIELSFDDGLYFRDFKVDGVPEGGYIQKHLTNSSGKSILAINFFFDEDISMDKLKMELIFQLDRTIKSSGYYSIEVDNASFYETKGTKIESDTENGAIHYQFKSDGENKYDKLFSDEDLVYYKNIDEKAELVYIEHSNQIITSRWKMGLSNNKKDESRVEIDNKYFVEIDKDYEKDIVETFSLRLTSSQKNELLSENVDFFYINPLDITFKVSKENIKEISEMPRYLEVRTSVLPKTILRQIGKENNSVISAYKVEADGVLLAELRFPIDESIPKRDLRIEVIDENGNEKRVIPYYISKPNNIRYACIEANPNSSFILTAPKTEVVETKLLSDRYYYLNKTFDIEATSYINENGNLMLPAKILSQFFNARLNWEAKRAQLEVYDGRTNIFNINSNIVIVDNSAIYIDVQPEYLNGHVFLPEVAFEEILNSRITYNKREDTIIIEYKK